MLLLRYLDLSKTEITKLPDSICNLWNLQTLRLLRCLWLRELPKGLAKLTSLRHLELDDIFWYRLSQLPAGAGSLRNLHNYRERIWSGRTEGFDEPDWVTTFVEARECCECKDAKLNEKADLRKVVLQWSKKDDGTSINEEIQENTFRDLQPQSEIEQLQIIDFSGSRLPLWIADGSPRKLTSVSLNHCINCKVLSLGQLAKLTSLYLKGMNNLECLGAQRPSLKILKVSGCPKLRVLPDCLFDLFILKIKECDSLKVLPDTPSLRFVTLMDNVILENWNEVPVSFTLGNDRGHQQTFIQLSLASLLEVKLIRCPMLKKLPQFRPRKLDISDCDQLRGLPPLRYSEHIKHLSLDTSNDVTLLSLIPDCASRDTLVISNISVLTSLPNLPSLPGVMVKALYIRGWADLEHQWEGSEDDNNKLQNMASLKFLSIQNCPKLRNLPSSGLPTTLESPSIGSCPSLQNLGPRQMLKTMTSLKDINIQNCESQERLPEDGFPDSVRHLKIHGCPMVAERCHHGLVKDSAARHRSCQNCLFKRYGE